MKTDAKCSGRQGRIPGVNLGAQLWGLIEQFGIIDQDMASLAIRGQAAQGDPTVEYHLQKLVRQKLLVRSRKKYYGRTVYHLRGLRQLGHRYRVAKLTQHLLAHPPRGKQISRSAAVLDGVKPDAVLSFIGQESAFIYLEYQTSSESWTTKKKVKHYLDTEGLKVFLIEREDGFLLEMAKYAYDLVEAGKEDPAATFCFANPDTLLASLMPWEDPLFYFGGSTGEKFPLVKPSRCGLLPCC